MGNFEFNPQNLSFCIGEEIIPAGVIEAVNFEQREVERSRSVFDNGWGGVCEFKSECTIECEPEVIKKIIAPESIVDRFDVQVNYKVKRFPRKTKKLTRSHRNTKGKRCFLRYLNRNTITIPNVKLELN